jgi:Vacuolar protein sorting-associated protein 35
VQIVIASFPDAYHVRTLQPLLHICQSLEPGVEVHDTMSLLMERLAAYSKATDENLFLDDSAFQLFLDAVDGIASRSAMDMLCRCAFAIAPFTRKCTHLNMATAAA